MTSANDQRLGKASGLSRRLLAVLVGLLAALALIVSGAGSASAQNAVGPQPVNSILVVGPHQAAGQENVGVRGPPGLRLVSATGVAADEGANALSYSAKITKQMGPRGWTQDSISETVKNPADTHSVWDYTTGDKQPATAYVQRGGGYVVVNDTTNEIVQVSDLNNSNWKPVWNDPRFQR